MYSVIVHASGVVCFGFALLVHIAMSDEGAMPAQVKSNSEYKHMMVYPGIWKFLTIWDVVVQFIYHSLALVDDFVGSSETNRCGQTALQKLRDGLFSSLAFGLGSFLSSAFWLFFTLDRETIFPKELDEFYPSWLNHAVHTAPIIFIFSELLTTPKIIPRNRKACLAINFSFTAAYLTWITFVHSQNGVWAYPILKILNDFERAILFMGCLPVSAGYYIIGEKLTRWRWGDGDDSDGSSGPKTKIERAEKGKKRSKRE